MTTEHVLKPENSYRRDTVPTITVEVPDGSRYTAYCPKDGAALQVAIKSVAACAADEQAGVNDLTAALADSLMVVFDEDAAAEIARRALATRFQEYGLLYVITNLLPDIARHYKPELTKDREALGLADDGDNGAQAQHRPATKARPAKKSAAKKPAAR